MTGTLGLSADEASWLLTVYSCSLFFGVPVSIWLAGTCGLQALSDRNHHFVRHRLHGLCGFIEPPDPADLAGDPGTCGSRAYQLVAGQRVPLMPKPQRSPSLMRISTVLYLSSAAGLLSSGYLTDRFNWRLIFLPNLFYAAGAVCLLLRYYPTIAQPAPSRVGRGQIGWESCSLPWP